MMMPPLESITIIVIESAVAVPRKSQSTVCAVTVEVRRNANPKNKRGRVIKRKFNVGLNLGFLKNYSPPCPPPQDLVEDTNYNFANQQVFTSSEDGKAG
jgi:hypothetical protein